MKLTLAKVLARTYKVHVASISCSVFNSLPTSGDLCHLLITFANSLEPDQARQNVAPALDPNCLTVLIIKEVSADNRLSLAKSLVTTGCHQQKVC